MVIIMSESVLYQEALKYVKLTNELKCSLEVIFRALKDGVYHKYSKSLFSRCKFQKLEDSGVEPLEGLKRSCSETSIIMCSDNVKNWAVWTF